MNSYCCILHFPQNAKWIIEKNKSIRIRDAFVNLFEYSGI